MTATNVDFTSIQYSNTQVLRQCFNIIPPNDDKCLLNFRQNKEYYFLRLQCIKRFSTTWTCIRIFESHLIKLYWAFTIIVNKTGKHLCSHGAYRGGSVGVGKR